MDYLLYFSIKIIMETTEKKKCKSCKKFTTYHWSLVVFSFYILFAAIYGTIKLAKEIMVLF
jgi:hypothetical protein